MPSCKYCHKNIGYNVDSCPHCGEKNPVKPMGVATDEGAFSCGLAFVALIAAGYAAKALTDDAGAAFLLMILLFVIFFYCRGLHAGKNVLLRRRNALYLKV